jgi:NitT/TauT family transport system ATP-binding protein
VRISVSNLDKAFGRGDGRVVAVEDVSFEIGRGEFVALLGPSGCGKSTILNMVAGLIPKTGGEILVDGRPMAHGEVRPEVGYVFQRDTVFPWRTVEANVGYGLEIAGVPRRERRARVGEALHQVGLGGFAKAFPRTLSGGMRQRVALMRTLITRPGILLMDEPFGALDTHTKLEMHRILLDIWERERQTVLFVTPRPRRGADARRPRHPPVRPPRPPEGGFRGDAAPPPRCRRLARKPGVRAPVLPHLALARRGVPQDQGRVRWRLTEPSCSGA